MMSIQMDIGGHPTIPTSSLCPFFAQHVFLYYSIIVSSTLLGLSKASHILQVDTSGLLPNPASIFCMLSYHHILLYIQSCFETLNVVFFTRHIQNVDKVRV
jgi:hypothetical protein